MTTLKKKNIILIPYPAQGHVRPMLKLATVLSNLNFRPVVITPEFIHHRLHPPAVAGDGILHMSIPDGLGGGGQLDFFAIERAMEETMPVFLEELVRRMIDGGDDVSAGGLACVVVDLLVSPAVEVGRRCGVAVVGFWPAMYATYRVIGAIPELIESKVISENGCPTNQDAPLCLSPIEPTLTTNDLPWLIGSSTARIARFRFWTRILERSQNLKCILMNTFSGEIEPRARQQSLADVSKTPHVFEIGPLIMQAVSINNRSLWEEDASCLDWLDGQSASSVLYVSFGSWVSPIHVSKIETLALALEALRIPFVWVLGTAWRQGLPSDYAERVSDHGRVVSWAPQVDVLRHSAVGCYLTHCGWNSTLEGIQCRKPLLCYPIAGDQFLNCKYIVEVWNIGVRIKGFEIEEVEDGIQKVVGDEQVKHRIERLYEKIFGKEGSLEAMANLSTFIQNLG
ncbi:UDP-Glycosyltransferase superfamily protein [Striga asiatica]|uniref:Glycosyltransferase n=1 Tax=Striga asiatica TaxID=4170 RepID=A0A5A7R9N9_STRAF|nr:UDP-Glycosyltransferase superfamily protein [Striga asiatica]